MIFIEKRTQLKFTKYFFTFESNDTSPCSSLVLKQLEHFELLKMFGINLGQSVTILNAHALCANAFITIKIKTSTEIVVMWER